MGLFLLLQVKILYAQVRCADQLHEITEAAFLFLNCGSQGKWHNRTSMLLLVPGFMQQLRRKTIISCLLQPQQYSLEQRLLRTISCNLSLDHETCQSILQTCTASSSLPQGQQLHTHLIKTGREVAFSGRLLGFYAMCRRLKEATKLFDGMPQPNTNIIAWNDMIRGYACSETPEEALSLYCQMRQAGIQSNNFTYPFLLKACSAAVALNEGIQIHRRVIELGLQSDVYVGSALVDLYGKCGCAEDARKMFDRMSNKDVVTWNAMIGGYVQNGFLQESVGIFRRMMEQSFVPSSVTIVNVLPAFGSGGDAVHGIVIKLGYQLMVSVATALLDMYFKAGNPESAQKVFDEMTCRNEITWTAMVSGYSLNELDAEALYVFQTMLLENVVPCIVSLVSMLKACAKLGALLQGQSIHTFAALHRLDEDVNLGNSIIALYAKCGLTDLAFRFFEKMPVRDAISWNAMFAGFGQNGQASRCLILFQDMLRQKIRPDATTMKSALPCCAQLSALQQGKGIHAYILRNGFHVDIYLANALIDMYAKCGKLDSAHQLFQDMPDRDIVSWNIMILGYGLHGCSRKALALFNELKDAGIQPDDVTFICVLIACSHAGLIQEGRFYFETMMNEFNFRPRMDHYICMVDLLGRAGYLDEAHRMIKSMTIKPDSNIWGALLAACKIHKNMELAEYIEKNHLVYNPEIRGHFALICNMYSVAKRRQDAERAR